MCELRSTGSQWLPKRPADIGYRLYFVLFSGIGLYLEYLQCHSKIVKEVGTWIGVRWRWGFWTFSPFIVPGNSQVEIIIVCQRDSSLYGSMKTLSYRKPRCPRVIHDSTSLTKVGRCVLLKVKRPSPRGIHFKWKIHRIGLDKIRMSQCLFPLTFAFWSFHSGSHFTFLGTNDLLTGSRVRRKVYFLNVYRNFTTFLETYFVFLFVSSFLECLPGFTV